MSQSVPEEVTESPGTLIPTSANADSSPLHFDQRPKPKGCKRLIQGLQRISSLPSLAKMGRISSPNYKSGGKASMSCVSFSLSSTTHSHFHGQLLFSSINLCLFYGPNRWTEYSCHSFTCVRQHLGLNGA